jgi:hypothetical protein
MRSTPSRGLVIARLKSMVTAASSNAAMGSHDFSRHAVAFPPQDTNGRSWHGVAC